jgi:hypothetical protein
MNGYPPDGEIRVMILHHRLHHLGTTLERSCRAATS